MEKDKILCMGVGSSFTSGVYILFPTTRISQPILTLRKLCPTKEEFLKIDPDTLLIQDKFEIDASVAFLISGNYSFREQNACGAIFAKRPPQHRVEVRRKTRR